MCVCVGAWVKPFAHVMSMVTLLRTRLIWPKSGARRPAASAGYDRIVCFFRFSDQNVYTQSTRVDSCRSCFLCVVSLLFRYTTTIVENHGLMAIRYFVIMWPTAADIP